MQLKPCNANNQEFTSFERLTRDDPFAFNKHSSADVTARMSSLARELRICRVDSAQFAVDIVGKKLWISNQHGERSRLPLKPAQFSTTVVYNRINMRIRMLYFYYSHCCSLFAKTDLILWKIIEDVTSYSISAPRLGLNSAFVCVSFHTCWKTAQYGVAPKPRISSYLPITLTTFYLFFFPPQEVLKLI